MKKERGNVRVDMMLVPLIYFVLFRVIPEVDVTKMTRYSISMFSPSFILIDIILLCIYVAMTPIFYRRRSVSLCCF
jgi:hypothetical protein